jgi:hypothetical protein
MAKGTDEFAGTTPSEAGNSIDPAELAGLVGRDGSDADDYARDADGNIIRNRDGKPARKRGRKAGSGSGSNSGTSKAQKARNLNGSIDTLSKTLMILHSGIAAIAKAPELEIDKDESDLLANATANVLDQFDLKPDPRAEAIVGLIIAASTVYGPRVYLMRQRKQAAKNAVVDVDSDTIIFPGRAERH